MAQKGAKLSQKDYLKKYLSGGGDDNKKKKKKKAKTPGLPARTKIIDDDVDLSKLQPLDESALDLYETNEDAPQIAGIVDERPTEVQVLDQFKQTQRWKVLSNPDGDGISVSSMLDSKKSSNENYAEHNQEKASIKNFSSQEIKREDDSDISPPRRKHSSDSDASPPRKRSANSVDASPPRRKPTYDSDASPPRKKGSADSVRSPPRRKHRGSDLSPPRRQHLDDSDPSFRRKKYAKTNNSSPRKGQGDDIDISPPRKRRSDNFVLSPTQKHRQGQNVSHADRRRARSPKKSRGPDLSPPRQTQYLSPSNIKQEDSDESPPRRTSKYIEKSLPSPKRKEDKNSFHSSAARSHDSPPPSHKRKTSAEKTRDDSKHTNKKMEKTLDGKIAGLQDASRLKEELTDVRRREDEAFARMDSSISGRGAAAVQRNRKTGMKRNIELEQAELQAKQEEENKRKEKYDRWGKGLKQTEDHRERFARDLHEMSKPLARYADDADLEGHLREQEREGDPMLEYLRTKKKDDAGSSQKVNPLYQGDFPPNRFSIRPGYRWDGRDRSNGYEKQWFQNMNARKATEEEAYKWSTSDM